MYQDPMVHHLGQHIADLLPIIILVPAQGFFCNEFVLRS